MPRPTIASSRPIAFRRAPRPGQFQGEVRDLRSLFINPALTTCVTLPPQGRIVCARGKDQSRTTKSDGSANHGADPGCKRHCKRTPERDTNRCSQHIGTAGFRADSTQYCQEQE